MKIALVTHKVDFHDGQGRVNFEIANALLEQGHSVTVVAEFCCPQVANHPGGRFVRTRDRAVPTQLLRNLLFAVTAGRWIRAHRSEFDLIQANGFVMWEPADIVAVHYVHGPWLRNQYFPFRWSSFSPYAWYQRFLAILNAQFELGSFAKARVLIAVSQSTAEELVGLGVPREKLRVVYNGVKLEEFYPGPSERETFGLPLEVPLALFAGDIRTPRKNLDTTLRALCQVPYLHLVVAGKLEKSPYPELAAKLGLADRVHFLGFTQKIAALMRSVDIFLMPSRYESFGMVAVEAMATSLPLILSSRVGVIELAGDTSLVIEDPDDIVGLATAMRQLAENPEQARSLGQAGRTRAQKLTWTSTIGGYLAVYRELMNDVPGNQPLSHRTSAEEHYE